MKRVFLAATALALIALSGYAKADVILQTSGAGTGDNVVFDSCSGSVCFGSFNGQHTGFARFTDLSGNSNFTGAANGNDIKISNTSDLNITVLGTDKTTQLFTTEDVFSLKGTGSVTASVIALNSSGQVEAPQTFTLGAIGVNESFFTFFALNGEVIRDFTLLDTGGVIQDFEHYRINVSTVPGPVVGAGLPGLLAAFGLWGVGPYRRWRRRNFA
jgi:hypothetical protein